jgi:hypothetical protein
MEIDTAEPLVPDPSPFEVEIAIVKLKNYKSPSSDQILAELNQAVGKTLLSEIQNSLILSGIRKNSLISGRSLLLYQFRKRSIERIVVIIVGYKCYEVNTKFYPKSSSGLSLYIDAVIGDHQCVFQFNRSTTDQIFCICQILEEELKFSETVHQLFINFKKGYDSLRREVLYNILIEFGVKQSKAIPLIGRGGL